LLKECESLVDIGHVLEECPSCGHLLSNNLTLCEPELASKVVPPFQTADTMKGFTFDIKELDGFFYGFGAEDTLCITGKKSNLISARLCVRSLLPKRQGGLESSVLFIDAGNNSDVYQCVSFARQYGIAINRILDGIIVSRLFTIHQLAHLVVHELPSAIRHFGTKLVVISGLLAMFIQDPQVNQKEAVKILDEIMQTIDKISKTSFVIITVDEPSTIYNKILTRFDNRLELTLTGNRIEVNAYCHNRFEAFSIPERDLHLIPTR